MKIQLSAIALAVMCAGCASVSTWYSPETDVTLPAKKSVDTIEVFDRLPQRASLVLGSMELAGNEYANRNTLVTAAKKKAAVMGADFVVILKSGTELRNVWMPGYATSWSMAGCNHHGDWYSGFSTYSPPYVAVEAIPRMRVVAGVFYPSKLGVRWDEATLPRLVVKEIEPASKAAAAGLRVGDEVLGVDGIDVSNVALPRHMLQVPVGQTVRLRVQRAGQPVEIETAMVLN